jgi:hypothetical protein
MSIGALFTMACTGEYKERHACEVTGMCTDSSSDNKKERARRDKGQEAGEKRRKTSKKAVYISEVMRVYNVTTV